MTVLSGKRRASIGSACGIVTLCVSHTAWPCGWEHETQVEVVGFSKDNRFAAFKYSYFHSEQQAQPECTYPRIAGRTPAAVALVLFEKGEEKDHWDIYEDPAAVAEGRSCTTELESQERLRQAQAAFAKGSILDNVRPKPLTILQKPQRAESRIVVPSEVASKYGIPEPITLYPSQSKQVEDEAYVVWSFHASSPGFTTWTFGDWKVFSFHSFRAFKFAWLSPDQRDLIFVYEDAAGASKPQFVSIAQIARSLRKTR